MRSPRRNPGPLFFTITLLTTLSLLTLLLTTLHLTRQLPTARPYLIEAFTATALILTPILYILLLRRANNIRDIQKSITLLTNGQPHRIPQKSTRELRDLTYSINTMASKLNLRIETIRQQRNQLTSLFEDISDGMLAVDTNAHLIDINKTLCTWLNLDPTNIQGRPLHEITRHPDIQHIIQHTLDTQKNLELHLTLPGQTERHIQARASLLNKNNQLTGILLILRDTTHLRQLESIRTDFVANVSHELKTPITAIKGYAETLTDLHDPSDPSHQPFLHIILKQANRLHAIVEDLLTLSRLEQKPETLETETIDLRQVISSAIQTLTSRAHKKNIQLHLETPQPLITKINASLIQQALTNLIENAIKYSPENTTIHIKAQKQKKQQLTLSISDQGPGIPPQEQERIFERFYRIDKGRSRDQGGTGLGLSIVKHIILAHQGNITIESQPRQGSTFIIHLPLT